MKEILMYGIFFASFFSVLRNSLAQDQLILFPFSISVPATFLASYYTSGGLYPDSTEKTNGVLHIQTSQITYGGRIKDSVFFNIDTHPTGSYLDVTKTVSFLWDSLNKKLKNFKYYFYERSTPSYPQYGDETRITLSSVNYDNSGDTIIVNDSGSTVVDQVLSAYYYREYVRARGPNPGQLLGETHTLEAIRRDDTIDFKFSIVLLPVQKDGIHSSFPISLKILESILSKNPTFLFPSSNYSQTLLIYDILGRETARVTIPASSSEYILTSPQLPSGHYFARLGNMSGHFEVY